MPLFTKDGAALLRRKTGDAQLLFNSIQYALFLPAALAVYWMLPRKVRPVFLLAVSYYFYMSWNAAYGLLLLGSTVLTYVAALLIQKLKISGKHTQAKGCLIVCLAAELAILFYYKYFNLFAGSFAALSGRSFEPLDILLPVGISFFIFQSIGYVIDVYRDAAVQDNPEQNHSERDNPEQSETVAEPDFINYALFISFFPQLVAGPIERSRRLLHQIRHPLPRPDYDMCRSGGLLILWGLFLKMVLADNLASMIDPVFSAYGQYDGVQLLLAVFMFAIQIYCDFGGYTYIAIGSARLFGFSLMENFRAPYMATDIKSFWARWHISLTSWFRDYLYIPLGGNRKGLSRKYLNTMIVFAASGLWHGADYKFLVWGLLNGAMLVGHDMLAQWRSQRGITPKPKQSGGLLLCRLRTFLLVCLTWLFFRADSIGDALQMLMRIVSHFGFRTLFNAHLFDVFTGAQMAAVVLLALMMLVWADKLIDRGEGLCEAIGQQPFIYRWLFYLLLIIAIFFFGVYGGEGIVQTQFIYFQF